MVNHRYLSLQCNLEDYKSNWTLYWRDSDEHPWKHKNVRVPLLGHIDTVQSFYNVVEYIFAINSYDSLDYHYDTHVTIRDDCTPQLFLYFSKK